MTADSRSAGTPSAGKLVFLALGLVVGACSGAAVAWVVQTRARNAYDARLAAMGEEAQPASRTAKSSLDQPLERATDSHAVEESVDKNVEQGARPESSREAQPDPLGEPLHAIARIGIAHGWAHERKDVIPDEEMKTGLDQFDATVRTRPEFIGRELAQACTLRERARHNIDEFDILGLLGSLSERGARLGAQEDVVRDPDSFARFFRRHTSEALVDGVAGRKPGQLRDGSTLKFPAGVFRLDHLFDTKPFPSDVTIAGAGMDSTLLVVDDRTPGAMPTSALTRLGFRDCTVRTGGRALIEQQGKPASLVLDRVRFIGFDAGREAGVFSGAERGLALQARECRFEGGYGGHTWSARLMDRGSDALVARFDQCRFEMIKLDVDRWPAGATALFADCSLIDSLDKAPLIGHPEQHPGVAFQNCTTTYASQSGNDLPVKDLNALFPDWQQRIQ